MTAVSEEQKESIKQRLAEGVLRFTFTKKDGTLRTMLATTNDALIPKVVHETNTDNPIDFPAKTPKAENPEVHSVYDLEAGGWRSFRWDSFGSITN